MEKKVYIIILALVPLLANAAISPADSSKTDSAQTRIESRAEHLSLWNSFLTGNSSNPVTMLHRYDDPLSELYGYVDYNGSNHRLLEQTGQGHTLFGIDANSYMHLNPNTTVWGGASYRNGTVRSVRYNSSADYLLLAPYVMADSLGGSFTNERYTFNGGIANQIGKFIWGASVDFRAEHEYRTYDPRPRGIVTDMTIRIGAAYQWANYNYGLGFGGVFYKQTNDVKFFREQGVIPEYHMTGLGSDYVRFSGTNTSAYYKATGLVADLTVSPVGKNGLYVTADYRYTPYKKILPSLNSLPLSTLYLQKLQSVIGWKQTSVVGWGIYAGADIEFRYGDEHIAGNPSGSEYRTIAKMTMFKSRLWKYYGGAALHFGKRHTVDLDINGGVIGFRSSYVDPHRMVNFNKPFGQLKAQYQQPVGHSSWLTVNVDLAYYGNSKDEKIMPYAYMDASRTRMVDNNYASATDKYFVGSGNVRFDSKPASWKGFGFFIAAGGGYTGSDSYHGRNLSLSIGATF